MFWYNKSVNECINELGSDAENGLSSKKAIELLEKNGRNELKQKNKKSLLSKIIDQFKDPMILILIGACIMSAVVGEITDAFIIIAIVIVNAILSLNQEGKAEKAIEALQKMASPMAKVYRDGKLLHIPSPEIVVGDIVELETGDIIPADLRLIESFILKIDEASLTGESVPVEKFADKVYDGEIEIGDRENMAYSSTIVSYGRGLGVVVSTGESTEIGKIATTLDSFEDENTPLQKKLAGLSKSLGVITIGVCVVVFIVGLLYRQKFLLMLLTAISLAVAAVPEGLPAIVTIVLSLGMTKMVKKNAIVKKLLAVETLGTTTVICSDKTGTLTQNEMTVKKVFVNNLVYDVEGTGYEPAGDVLLDGEKVDAKEIDDFISISKISTLVNDAKLIKDENMYRIAGDPTEGALLTLSEKVAISKDDLNNKHKRIAEIPFDSTRKMMTTFNENIFSSNVISATKGAPDIVIDNCKYILINGKEEEFTLELKEKVLLQNSQFAKQALRVLAFAYRKFDSLPEEKTSENIEKDMVFVGLMGMIDPARPEAKEAIKECKKAGIIPIMITGDYLETAVAIAKDLGILDDNSKAIMGRELNKMTEEEICEVVKTTRVFARVSPENKVQIVSALKKNGHIAAMTGDGVNDAPAIKRADIGVSMGITGTDVAKNTSDVILTDDNFATIVSAVHEGRIIYSNIKKFVSFLLSCNVGEILIVLISILLNIPVPFVPIQLLWLNLVTDSFPALALGVEKGDEDIMHVSPRNPNEPILDKEMVYSIISQSLAITTATLVAYFYGMYHYPNHIEGARTVAFFTLITAELLRSYSVRSSRFTLFHIGVFSNKTLVYGTTLSFFMMLVVVYVPFLQPYFDTVSLGIKELAVAIPLAFLPFIVAEVSKVMRKK